MKKTFTAVTFLIFMLLMACRTDPDVVEDIFDVADPGIEKAEDFEMVFSDSGRIKARISGEILLHYLDPADPKDEFPEGVSVLFYNKAGEVQSWLDARYAIRKGRDQLVVMRDSVVMKNIKGERLHTSELIWDEKVGMVSTEKFSKITKVDGTVLYCYGFESNEQFTDYTLLSIEGPVNIDALKEEE